MKYAITAELGRALAVVKVTLQINGNSQFSRVRTPKNYWGIKDKIWHKWVYVAKGNPHAKFGNIEITEGFSSYWWNI